MKALRSESKRLCNPRPLAGYCLCFLAGIFLSRYFSPDAWLWLPLLMILPAAIMYKRHPRIALSMLACLLCLAGFMRGAQAFHAQRFTPEDKGILTGTVKEIAYREHAKSQVILTDARIEDTRLEAGVVLTVYGSFEGAVGDVIRCTVKLQPIENYPDADFDYKLWRLSENTAYQATGSKAQNLGVNESLRYLPLRFAAELKTVMYAMYAERAGMAVGMSLGNTEQMTDDQLAVFRAAGIAHILSVSGLNFAFFMVVLQWLMGRRTYVSTVRFAITLMLLWGYCAVVGWPASAVRACLMLSLYLLAQWAGWQYDLLTSLCFAAALIAAVRPAQLFAAGFCLSFSATAGIAFFYQPFVFRLRRIKKMPKIIAQSLAVWASAQIGILPFMLLFFQTVQVYGAIGNLLIVPLSSVVTIGGLVSGLAGLACYGIGQWIAWAVGGVCWLIEAIARVISNLPAAQITLADVRLVPLLSLCAMAVVCSRYCLLKSKEKWAAGGTLAALILITSL